MKLCSMMMKKNSVQEVFFFVFLEWKSQGSVSSFWVWHVQGTWLLLFDINPLGNPFNRFFWLCFSLVCSHLTLVQWHLLHKQQENMVKNPHQNGSICRLVVVLRVQPDSRNHHLLKIKAGNQSASCFLHLLSCLC